MTRFGGRAIAALAVWVGLAVLGYGPRAAASFLPFATQMPQSNPCADSGGAGGAPADVQKPSDVPLTLDALLALKVQDCSPQSPASGGAGSGPTTSSGPTGSAVVLVAGTDPTGPSLTTRLRWRESLQIPDPITAAIFEPPRAG